MSSGIVIPGAGGKLMEWSAPIDYGSVKFHGWGGHPNAGTFYHSADKENHHGALVNGPTWRYLPEIDRWSTYHVNASAQYIRATGINTIIPGSTQFTLAWWARRTSDSARCMAGQWQGANPDFTWVALASRWSIGDVTFYAKPAGAGFPYGHTAGGVLTLNKTHHIAVIYNGAGANNAARLRIAVDGVFQTLTFDSTILASINTHVSDFYWGRQENDAARDWDGNLADCILSPNILSDASIRWLAKRENNPWKPYRRKSWAVTSGAAPVGDTIQLPFLQVNI